MTPSKHTWLTLLDWYMYLYKSGGIKQVLCAQFPPFMKLCGHVSACNMCVKW